MAGAASAHESRPAYLQLTQTEPERFQVLWKVPQRGDMVLSLRVQWPAGCREVSLTQEMLGPAVIHRGMLNCPDDKLIGGRTTIDGLASMLTDVLARIEWLDGRVDTRLIRPNAPWFEVQARASWVQTSSEYLVLGVEHILGGVDHLLFVLGLLMIVRGTGLLIKTITAFTLAHSVTLALATLGVVHVPAAPVEAVIALSIAFLAREWLREHHGERTLTARFPWIVALTFGLLHGFGFAGALSEVGLPEGDIPLALLFFNVGVEVGQLAFVAAVLAMARLARHLRISFPKWAALAPPYAIGSVATFWVIQRVELF